MTPVHVCSYYMYFQVFAFNYNHNIGIYILAAKGREALYSQQKQDWKLTVAQIMDSLLPNSDFN